MLPDLLLSMMKKRVPFDSEKIVNTIKKSRFETGDFGEAEARYITFKVVKILTYKYKNEIPDIEQIHDLVEVL